MNDFKDQNEIFKKVTKHLTIIAQRQMPEIYDDLVQETLYCFFDNINKGKYLSGNSYPEYFSYSLGILKNIIIKQIRENQLKRKIETGLSRTSNQVEQTLKSTENSEFNLLKEEEEEENAKLIAGAREIFLQFPPHIRELIHLHVVEEMSYSKLSEYFGVPKQTLVSRFNSAIEKMRKKLDSSHTNNKNKY